MLQWEYLYACNAILFGRPLKGSWRIIEGKMADPAAVIYALDTGLKSKTLFLLKEDENVLFILDEKYHLLTGDRDFSYTLNRVQKVLRQLPR